MRSSFLSATRRSHTRRRQRRIAANLAIAAALVCSRIGLLAPAPAVSLERAGAFPLPPETPVCVEAVLLGGTLDVTCCIDAKPGFPWHASAELRSMPLEAFARFLPEPARNLRGGSISGTLVLSGTLLPENVPEPRLYIQGSLRPDSLWWPAGEDFSEWILRDVDFSLQMTISRGPESPRYEGFLEAHKAHVGYLGHDLAVTDIRLSFGGSPTFDPLVKLTASVPVVSNAGVKYRVHFDLIGPATQARPRLTSVPSLGRQDVESLLTLGVPLSAFSDDPSADDGRSYFAQQIFLLRALEIAAERIVGLAEQHAEHLLGVDEVRVPTARSLAQGESEMEIAKRLGQRATLSYTSSVWRSGAYRVRLDFRLTEHVSLESENDQTGDAGVDLRFKKRFR